MKPHVRMCPNCDEYRMPAEWIALEQLNDELVAALRLLVADVQDYEAWQRPCHALDVARAALAKASA